MKKTFLTRIALITAIFTTFSAVLKENFIALNDPFINRLFYPFVFLVAVTSSFIISVWMDKKINEKNADYESEKYRRSVLKYGIILFLSGIVFFISFITFYQYNTGSWNEFDSIKPDVLQGVFTSEIQKASKASSITLPTDGTGHYNIYHELASHLDTIEKIYGRFYTKNSIINIRLKLLLLYLLMSFTFCSAIYMTLEYLQRFSTLSENKT